MKKTCLIHTALVLGTAGPVQALAHSGSTSSGQHFIEHLLLLLIMGVPVGYALLRLLSGAKRETAE